VRIQRVALEDHRDVAVALEHVVTRLTADVEVAGRDVLEAGDHPQRVVLPQPDGPTSTSSSASPMSESSFTASKPFG
jgi:hypothetical protein